MATFSDFVFNVDSQSPAQIGPSLSAADNSVVFVKTDSTYKAVTFVSPTVFTTLSPTQLTAITTNSNISGFYSGWTTAGVPVGAKYSGTDFKALTAAYSLSALSAQLVVITTSILSTSEFGTGKLVGTIKTPVGVVYDAVASPSTNTVTLSVADNIQVQVSTSYNGATFGLYFDDRSTSLFAVNTAATGYQTVSALSLDNRGPNERRRFAVEL